MDQPRTPDDVYDDDTRARLSDTDIRTLASEVPGLDQIAEDADIEHLRRHLSRYHDGGVVVHHDAESCGYVWVYGGDPDNTYVACPSCKSSISLDKYAVRPQLSLADLED